MFWVQDAEKQIAASRMILDQTGDQSLAGSVKAARRLSNDTSGDWEFVVVAGTLACDTRITDSELAMPPKEFSDRILRPMVSNLLAKT